ncbi:MAG: glycosyltransferase [Mesorhizobium sp.]|uniref:glycosyltransferase n=2 Tax=unclassified Mesorhizobium TaxID=325217 RepID=UPI001212FD05|nr:glycosyltransferase [Mesorhizobium sp.]TIL82921.1 MAG: glycosyltransferase [Mesorhizobium sp.]TIW34789.1 MAG: glycosyltransferase [Mesorhizobium sp.]
MSRREDATLSAGYDSWRQSRLAERMALAGQQRTWNHLITVLIHDAASASRETLSHTLSSLLGQTYRNIEIVVAGVHEIDLPDVDDFTSLRGLFAEPTLDALNVLSDPAHDHLWRGSHLVFAAAGTTFDTDAFALLNRMLSPLRGTPMPDLIVCDHDRRDAGAVPQPCFLPGWDPDLIVSMDYVGTAFMASRKLIFSRRSAERPNSLHGWLRTLASGPLAVGHLTETVMHLPTALPRPSAEPADMRLPRPRSVAIVIPNRDQPKLLKRCVGFVKALENLSPELVIVDHASTDPATLALYAELQEKHGARIVRVHGRFNFSRMVNMGVAAATADVVVLLNNDVEITHPRQLELMVAHAMRPEVGVVGARLLYPDGSVQHAGIVLQPGSHSEHPVLAQHVLRGAPGNADGYLHAMRTVRNYQAVTGAIVASRRTVFHEIGGFDEVCLPVEYNDVDYCLRARLKGFRVIALPTDGIIHRESATRGSEATPEVLRMRIASMRLIAERWREAVDQDPFCNPHVDMGDRPQAGFPWTDRVGNP